jgi:hypothetical protein
MSANIKECKVGGNDVGRRARRTKKGGGEEEERL